MTSTTNVHKSELLNLVRTCIALDFLWTCALTYLYFLGDSLLAVAYLGHGTYRCFGCPVFVSRNVSETAKFDMLAFRALPNANNRRRKVNTRTHQTSAVQTSLVFRSGICLAIESLVSV